jgi:DNA replication protein DnaC
MTNEDKCVISRHCKVAGGPTCNNQCPAFISLHGHSGKGGRIANANTPADYRLLTLANSPAREGQAKVYATLEKYAATFERQFDENAPRIKSLFLWSESPGTGKTTSATALLNEYIIANYLGSLKRDRQALQRPAVMLDVNEWQSLFNEFNRSNLPADIAEPASREYYRRLQQAKLAPFAVLDDIGVRSATEAFRGDLHSVINHRTANGLPTVFTSNLPLKEMATVFDARLFDRMKDQCAEIHFEGTSKRGRR